MSGLHIWHAQAVHNMPVQYMPVQVQYRYSTGTVVCCSTAHGSSHALQELLAAGKGPGMSWRATESGQVLLDLVQHGDVAEWALWINSFGDTVYRALWGDKDTYALAFAVAGKAHGFNQLQVMVHGSACGMCALLLQASCGAASLVWCCKSASCHLATIVLRRRAWSGVAVLYAHQLQCTDVQDKP